MLIHNELFNKEARQSPNFRSNYSPSISNAFYSVAASLNRKRKRPTNKLIRVYAASKMACGNSHLGPFTDGKIVPNFIIISYILLIGFDIIFTSDKALKGQGI